MADLKRYLTDPSLIAEGFFRQISSYSVFKNKSEFKVRVLTSPVQAGTDKVRFKGRILDKNMPHEKFLPDPCDDSIAADKELVDRLLAMHSTVLAEGIEGSECAVGDIILAFVDPGDNNNLYDLQNLKFIKIETKNNKPLVVGDECLTLSQLDYGDSIYFPQNVTSVNPGSYTDPKDPGYCTWSNGARASRAVWQSQAHPQYNGTEFLNGFLENTGIIVKDTSRGRVELLPPAYADWVKLAKAYEKRFPGKQLRSNGGGYRTYGSQVNVKIQRSGCRTDKYAKCGIKEDGKSCNLSAAGSHIGVAATPGTSRHGWAAAVDLNTTDWSGGTDSEDFIWLNKFGHKYNWVFNVGGEKWHISWMNIKSVFPTVSAPGNSWVTPAGAKYDAMTETAPGQATTGLGSGPGFAQ